MTEKEAVATTPIDRYYDTTTTFTGTYIVDRIQSQTSTMVGVLAITLAKLKTQMENCNVLTDKKSFSLSQHDQTHIEKSLNDLEHSMKKLQKAVIEYGEGINDWKFTNDMRALQLSIDDLTISVLDSAENTRHVAAEYNWRKYAFILREIGISEDIIKIIDDAKRKHILKSGRRKGEHQDPWALTRKWYKKILLGFALKFKCLNCGHENEIKDNDLIQYIELDKSTRHMEANNP